MITRGATVILKMKDPIVCPMLVTEISFDNHRGQAEAIATCTWLDKQFVPHFKIYPADLLEVYSETPLMARGPLIPVQPESLEAIAGRLLALRR